MAHIGLVPLKHKSTSSGRRYPVPVVSLIHAASLIETLSGESIDLGRPSSESSCIPSYSLSSHTSGFDLDILTLF
jgi:hypothetical protein